MEARCKECVSCLLASFLELNQHLAEPTSVTTFVPTSIEADDVIRGGRMVSLAQYIKYQHRKSFPFPTVLTANHHDYSKIVCELICAMQYFLLPLLLMSHGDELAVSNTKQVQPSQQLRRH